MYGARERNILPTNSALSWATTTMDISGCAGNSEAWERASEMPRQLSANTLTTSERAARLSLTASALRRYNCIGAPELLQKRRAEVVMAEALGLRF